MPATDFSKRLFDNSPEFLSFRAVIALGLIHQCNYINHSFDLLDVEAVLRS